MIEARIGVVERKGGCCIQGMSMNQFVEAICTTPEMNADSIEAQIERLLQDAAEYATKSIASMVAQLEEDYGTPNKLFYDYVRLMHALEVHFLFPNLSDLDRDLIAALLTARSAMLVGLKKLEVDATSEARQEREAAITHLRNRFGDLKRQIESRRLLERLTSVQRRILEETFLALLAG